MTDGRRFDHIRTLWGRYGSSSCRASSSVSVTSRAPTACSSCSGLLTPMIGAVTPGCRRSHASATCGALACFAAAIAFSRSATSKSASV